MRCTSESSLCLPFALRSSSSSKATSKWSSIARFPRPVTSTTSSMPDATASSTTYWMSGLSTSGSISLGDALVAGRNRVPSPAAGKTAFGDPAFWHNEIKHLRTAGTAFYETMLKKSRTRAGNTRSGYLGIGTLPIRYFRSSSSNRRPTPTKRRRPVWSSGSCHTRRSRTAYLLEHIVHRRLHMRIVRCAAPCC